MATNVRLPADSRQSAAAPKFVLDFAGGQVNIPILRPTRQRDNRLMFEADRDLLLAQKTQASQSSSFTFAVANTSFDFDPVVFTIGSPAAKGWLQFGHESERFVIQVQLESDSVRRVVVSALMPFTEHVRALAGAAAAAQKPTSDRDKVLRI